MLRTSNIQSLTEFQRDTKATIAKLKRNGAALVLTVNGRAELVVQHAEAYQALMDRLERLETIEGVRQGLEDIKAGRTVPLAEAMKQIRARKRVRRPG
jgi:PHD/YefM family antitoxin component YafN of YafNO toxin-antitoxin module